MDTTGAKAWELVLLVVVLFTIKPFLWIGDNAKRLWRKVNA